MSATSKRLNWNRPIKEVIVYQMGKVGSTSIVASLNSAGVPAYQSHFLDTPSFHEIVDMFGRHASVGEEVSHHISIQLQENLLLRNKLTRYQKNETAKDDRLGIITLVRDPLAWYFSNLSQNFFEVEKHLRRWLVEEGKLSSEAPLTEQHLQYFLTELFNCFDQIIPDMNQSYAQLIETYFNEAGKTASGKIYRFIYSQVSVLHRVHFWFDKHFASLLDLDVLRYEFDTSKGFTVFQRGNIDIILMKFEKLGELNNELARFLGLASFTMNRLNESKDKVLGKLISKTTSDLRIPEHFRRKYYSSEYYETFYAEKSPDNHLLSYPRLQERRQDNSEIYLINNPTDDVSNYNEQKRIALKSFLSFTNTGELPEWPLELSIGVSNLCDIGCAMCPSFSPLNRQRSLYLAAEDRDLLNLKNLEFIEDLLQHAIMVHLGGYGEPTQHPEFSKLLEFLAHYEVLIDFSTHGFNLTEVLCDCIVRHGIHRININISGANKEDYESVYVGSEFNRVLDNIRLLANTKKKYSSVYPIISIDSIAFDFHLATLPLFVNIMAEVGADEVTLHPLDTYDEIPQLHSRCTIMKPSRDARLLDQAHEIARQHDIMLNTEPFTVTANLPGDTPLHKAQFRHQGNNPLSSEHISLTEIRTQCLNERVNDRIPETCSSSDANAGMVTSDDVPAFVPNTNIPCFEAFKALGFSQDGRVYPCTFGTNETAFGSITPGLSGQNIWHNQALLQFRKHALIQELPLKHCSNCVTSGKYPKQHNLAQKMAQYSSWFWDMFHAPFHPTLQESMADIRTNTEVLAHINKTQKTVYLHIGSPKTEAVSIQKYLSENYNYLLNTYGLLYPKEGRHCISHTPLAADLRSKYNKDKVLDHCYGNNSRGDNWEKLIQEMKKHNNNINKVVICSEDFFTLYKFHNPESINAIRSILSDFRVIVIVYLLRQDKLIESLFSQEIKATLKSISSAEHLIFRHPTTRSNYYDMLSAWAEAFGEANIIVRPFDYQSLENSDVVSDFMHTIGIDYGAKSNGIRYKDNNLTQQEIIFKLAMNKIYDDNIECNAAFYKIVDKMAFKRDSNSILLTECDYANIVNKSININKLLSDKFYDGKPLFHDFQDSSGMKFVDSKNIDMNTYIGELLGAIDNIELDDKNRQKVMKSIDHICADWQIEV